VCMYVRVCACMRVRVCVARPVKIIRLLGRDSVEEIVYSRAASKLELTNAVVEDGRFSLLQRAQAATAGLQVAPSPPQNHRAYRGEPRGT